MKDGLKQADQVVHTPPDNLSQEPHPDEVAHELSLILASPFFRASKRSQQFLKFVVQYRLDGNNEPLKERKIGTLLYKRAVDYATGEDSVVRVQAGEVRRRLEQYYQVPPADSLVRIDLPLGSYVPEFRWTVTPITFPENPAARGPDSLGMVAAAVPNPTASRGSRKSLLRIASFSSTVLLLAGVLVGLWNYRERSSESVINQFWSPIFNTSKPLLICLPKTVVYRPSITLYKRHAKTSDEFDREVDRMNNRPTLRPDEGLVWGDMIEYSDFALGKGDVKAAFRLSGLFVKLRKDSELRVGGDYGWDDLRNSPAVIIGAFSNPWTIKLTSGLHFAFVEPQPGEFRIQEQGPSGRVWFPQTDARTSAVTSDYGLLTRLINSGTGQFVTDVAGINAPGSEAAAEVATSQEDLEKALRSAPPGWKRKNVQILVKTTVVDGLAGPPEIVAVYVW
jgi:hypothetical protein